MYHTELVIWLLNNVEDANTTIVGNCNSGVTLSSLEGYYEKFYMWVKKNGMANLRKRGTTLSKSEKRSGL